MFVYIIETSECMTWKHSSYFFDTFYTFKFCIQITISLCTINTELNITFMNIFKCVKILSHKVYKHKNYTYKNVKTNNSKSDRFFFCANIM